MDFAVWLIAIGVLLIGIHASSHVVARLPASPALIYLVVGMVLGPWGIDVLHPDPVAHGAWLERACELAVIVSLFATGSCVGSTLRVAHWRVPVRLASIAMVVTILLLGLFAFFALGLSAGAAVLLAAALAPTDPVLAGDVHVADANDRDRVRFGLTGEAGLNDGAAYPFVLLGLALLSVGHAHPGGWLAWTLAVAWGVMGGLAIGAALGWMAGRWTVMRARAGVTSVNSDAFFGLGLVAVAYGTAVTLGAYGFLTVFAAAVALQWTVAGEGAASSEAEAGEPHPAIAPLQQFNADLESLVEFAIVLVIGALLAIVDIPWEAIAVTVVLFVIVRPVSVLLALRGVRLEGGQRLLACWFGIRGVGSLFYVFFALASGWQGPEATRVLGIVVGVVAASIVLHGVSVTPLMNAYVRHGREWARRRTAKSVHGRRPDAEVAGAGGDRTGR